MQRDTDIYKACPQQDVLLGFILRGSTLTPQDISFLIAAPLSYFPKFLSSICTKLLVSLS